MSNAVRKKPTISYQAPTILVGLFYLLLLIWTIASVGLLALNISTTSTLLLLMIAFFIGYTWYFSLGIFYRINMENDGSIQMKSFRRIVQSHCRKIEQVEGPPVPLAFGFMKFRLDGEKNYVFFTKHVAFRQILSDLRKRNPEIRFKKLLPAMFQTT